MERNPTEILNSLTEFQENLFWRTLNKVISQRMEQLQQELMGEDDLHKMLRAQGALRSFYELPVMAEELVAQLKVEEQLLKEKERK